MNEHFIIWDFLVVVLGLSAYSIYLITLSIFQEPSWMALAAPGGIFAAMLAIYFAFRAGKITTLFGAIVTIFKARSEQKTDRRSNKDDRNN